MMRHLGAAILISCGLVVACAAAHAAGSTVPEPFQGFNDSSKYTINYDDLTTMLDIVVADVGRSNREKAARSSEQTGTRLKAKINRYTINEGNRFYFETFVDDETAQRQLNAIQKGIEQATSEVPLERFSRDEQLAYWLNLYNVTVLNEIVKVYPQRNLEKLLKGKRSFLAKKILTVQGVPLSLDDIQFTILKQNYDNDPLVLYGLYQGIIGAPNIRRSAYTGADVYRALKDNAVRFINSNRGTASKNAKSFRVSSFYERNWEYFPNFETDVTAHLSDYLEGDELAALQAASSLKPDINDWTVTDLGGTRRVVGGSLAMGGAGLLGAVSGASSSNYGATASSGDSNSGSSGGINMALAGKVQENKGNASEEGEVQEEDADSVSEDNQEN